MRMKETPPGMKNNMPKRPGVMPRPPKPPVSGGGRGRGGATPPPGMMYGPNDALIPIPKKGGGTPVRDSRGDRSGGPRTMGGPASKMGSGPAKTGTPMMRAKGGMVKSSSKKK